MPISTGPPPVHKSLPFLFFPGDGLDIARPPPSPPPFPPHQPPLRSQPPSPPPRRQAVPVETQNTALAIAARSRGSPSSTWTSGARPRQVTHASEDGETMPKEQDGETKATDLCSQSSDVRSDSFFIVKALEFSQQANSPKPPGDQLVFFRPFLALLPFKRGATVPELEAQGAHFGAAKQGYAQDKRAHGQFYTTWWAAQNAPAPLSGRVASLSWQQPLICPHPRCPGHLVIGPVRASTKVTIALSPESQTAATGVRARDAVTVQRAGAKFRGLYRQAWGVFRSRNDTIIPPTPHTPSIRTSPSTDQLTWRTL
ncbi:unnamed protein product [Parajaminaea phylloscopi]